MNVPVILVDWLDAAVVAPDGRHLSPPFDWRVAAGEFWCLVGPNGAGKSSLVAALAGLLPRHAGTLRIAGQPIRACSPARLAQVRGLLPQSVETPFGLDALQTVMLAHDPGQHAGRRARTREAAFAALARLGVDTLARRDVATLSGGERQRVALAALLAQAPRLYLLDEPLTHLDLRHQAEAMRLFAELAGTGEAAVIAAVHDISLAARHATHAVLLDPGSPPRLGPADEVLDPEIVSRAFDFPLRRIVVDGAPTYVPGACGPADAGPRA